MYTGAIDIDSSLISANSKLAAKEDIISMDNGCVCCTVRGDLVEAFKKLAAREEKYDAVLIETTGAFFLDIYLFVDIYLFRFCEVRCCSH